MSSRRPSVPEQAVDIRRVLQHEGVPFTVPQALAEDLYRTFGVPLPPNAIASRWPTVKTVALRIAAAGVTAERVYNELNLRVPA